MPMQTICRIRSVEYPNPDAVSMLLEAGAMAALAQPGQFVNIKCSDGQLLRRPISICDAGDGVLRIVFEVRGEGTAWLSHRKVGEFLNVLGPLGRGYRIPKGKVLVVGGGIGVPPMLYTARAADAATVCLGFRGAEKGMLLDDFSAACGEVLVTSDDGTLGEHGFVDALVRCKLAEESFACVMACGPKPMLRAVANAAKEVGVPCQVSLEERMGCGIGACLVCACKIKTADGTHYLHVCKDGPVFDAEEVCWDA